MNKNLAHQLKRSVAERGIYCQFFKVDKESGVLRIGHRPIEPAGGDWADKMANLIGMYLTAEQRGLNSQQLEIAILCPHCGEAVITRYQVLADWAEQHQAGKLSLGEVVDNVMATEQFYEH